MELTQRAIFAWRLTSGRRSFRLLCCLCVSYRSHRKEPPTTTITTLTLCVKRRAMPERKMKKKPGSVLCCSLMSQSLRFHIPISLCFECLVCIGRMFVSVLFGVTHISVRDHPSGVRHALTGLITFILFCFILTIVLFIISVLFGMFRNMLFLLDL